MSLTPATLKLADALRTAVAAFRVLAAGWLDGSIRTPSETRYLDFDRACSTAAGSLHGADFTAILNGPDPDAGSALFALLVERQALGRPLRVLVNGVLQDHLLPDHAMIMTELRTMERAPLAERLALYAEPGPSAAWAVGIHLARQGEWDPFAFDGWAPEVMGESILAAAVTTAALSRVRFARLGDPERVASASHGAVSGLTHVAEAAYYALDSEARGALSGGFGSESDVIEDLLYAADDLETLDVHDVHRLSGSLFRAFLAGLGSEDLNVLDEPSQEGRDLLAAAYAVGAVIHHHDEEDDAFPPDPFDLPTGRPPERHLLN